MSTATAPIPLVLYPALARHQSNSNMITYTSRIANGRLLL